MSNAASNGQSMRICCGNSGAVQCIDCPLRSPYQGRLRCAHCGKTRRRPGGLYCCCLPNEAMIRRNKNQHRCPQCHLAYTDD